MSPRGPDAPNTARAQRRAATRRRFLASAHAMARTGRGGDPLDPADVAVHAGVSRPLFYAHFRTRGDFVEALLASIHESPPSPAGPVVAPSAPDATPADAIELFFAALAGPLDRHAPLARVLIPASHAPGPVATARAARRAMAVSKIEALLPPSTPERAQRAAFLMDTFLGIQLRWALEAGGETLADRVRRGIRLAVTGALADLPSVSPRVPSRSP